MNITRAALFKIGGVSVMRSVYNLPTQLLTTRRRSSFKAFVPGKREAVCPSGPIPSSTRSKRGDWSACNLKLVRNSSSYSSAACAAFRFSALMRCTCFGSTGALLSLVSLAIRKLLSALSGGAGRSSPKKNWILLQGTFACSRGLVASSPYKAFGVNPPASATLKESFSRTASRAASRNAAAAVCAILLAYAKILISRLVVIVLVFIFNASRRSRAQLRLEPRSVRTTAVLLRSFAMHGHRAPAIRRRLPGPRLLLRSWETVWPALTATRRGPAGSLSSPPQPCLRAGIKWRLRSCNRADGAHILCCASLRNRGRSPTPYLPGRGA